VKVDINLLPEKEKNKILKQREKEAKNATDKAKKEAQKAKDKVEREARKGERAGKSEAMAAPNFPPLLTKASIVIPSQNPRK
jgi:vacuolar-type H+-ATPase subunit E/Vma4